MVVLWPCSGTRRGGFHGVNATVVLWPCSGTRRGRFHRVNAMVVLWPCSGTRGGGFGEVNAMVVFGLVQVPEGEVFVGPTLAGELQDWQQSQSLHLHLTASSSGSQRSTQHQVNQHSSLAVIFGQMVISLIFLVKLLVRLSFRNRKESFVRPLLEDVSMYCSYARALKTIKSML